MRSRAFAATTQSQALLAGAAFLVLAALPLLAAGPALAGNGYDPKYAYCLTGQTDGMGELIPDCSFNTNEQCRVAAMGSGYCINNPAYVPAAAYTPAPAAQPQRGRTIR